MKYFLLSLLTLIILLTSGYFYQNKSLSLHFVDEEDNIVLGSYILKGDKLYKDLFSHHQPLAYILSASVQKITTPESIFLLIKRHREVMIAISIICSVLMVFRFGKPAFFTVLVFEFTKIFLLGNLFLSESLVVYPLLYLFLLTFEENKPKKLEGLVVGFCFSWCIFLLAPLWPVLFVLALILFIKKKLKNFKFVILGFLPLFFICLFFLDINQYFFNAFYINFKYYIPSDGTRPGVENIIKAVLSPFLVFTDREITPILYLLRIYIVIFIFLSGVLVLFKKYKLVFITWAVLAFANLRFIEPGQDYYRGFHLLPWYVLLLSSIFLMNEKLFEYNKKMRLFSIVVPIVLIIFSLYKTTPVLFKKDDLQNQWYINYSEQFNIGEAVRIMSNESVQETIFVAPDEWLIYWQSGINHASSLLNYYAWMVKTPPLSEKVNNMFQENPPTYFYCPCPKGYLNTSFYDGYSEMVKNGRNTNLFVKEEKLKTLTLDQKNKLKFFEYKMP